MVLPIFAKKMNLPGAAKSPGTIKAKMTLVNLFFHQRLNFQISSAAVSISEILGGQKYA